MCQKLKTISLIIGRANCFSNVERPLCIGLIFSGILCEF